MASSAPGTLVTGAVRDDALCVAEAAPLQAVDRSVPLSSANCCVSALCLWAGPRTRCCKMPASRCSRPAYFKLFSQLSMAVVASIFGVLCQQCQLMRDSVAVARGPLCQQPAIGSARRMTLELECACVCRSSEDANVVSVISMYYM